MENDLYVHMFGSLIGGTRDENARDWDPLACIGGDQYAGKRFAILCEICVLTGF